MSDQGVELRNRMREEERRKNREKMPNLAAVVDELRERFPGAKLIWGKDLVTGHEVGKLEEPDPDKVFTIPKDYFPSTRVETKPKKGKR
jgi:hypothetical protein